MKIGFITDTNILKNKDMSKKNNFMSNMKIFCDYIESLEETRCKNKLIYYMPNIIIEELYHHKKFSFNEKYNILLEIYNEINYGTTGVLPVNNIENILKEERKLYENKYRIINLDYNQDIFKELVEDALEKRPPFDKSIDGRKTDAGYKDALIWKTILYNQEIEECDKLYLFSGDKIFEDNNGELQEEFKKHHSSTELIIKYVEPNGRQRQRCLQILINENNLIETDIIKLYNKDLILEYFKSLKFSHKQEICYYEEENKIILEDINFEDFDKNDFWVDDVKKDSEDYKVITEFYTKKYSTNEGKESSNKRNLVGKTIFNFKEKDRKFELIDYSITNVRFNFSILSNLIDFIKESLKSLEYINNQKMIEVFKNSLNEMSKPTINLFDNMESTDLNSEKDKVIEISNKSNDKEKNNEKKD